MKVATQDFSSSSSPSRLFKPQASAHYHLSRRKLLRPNRIWFCCGLIGRTLQSVWNRCLNYLLKQITGLNKIERILMGGIPKTSLIVSYHPPTVPRTVDNAVIKHAELIIHETLEQNYNHLLESQQLTASELEAGATSLGASLGVRSEYLPVLKSVLTELRRAYWMRQAILQLQQTPFDAANPDHTKALNQFWDALMDELPRPERYGQMDGPREPRGRDVMTSWSDVGFQSIPSKDFRSAGYLGAINLLWFSGKHRLRARHVFAETGSFQSRSWFPFAATGLNVTMWVLALMNDGYLDVFFFNNTTSTAIEIFNTIYSFVFLEFSSFWKLYRPQNILQFGEISKQFLDKIETTLEEISSPSYHSEWIVPLTSTGDELVEELRCWIDGEVLHAHHSTATTARNISPASRFVAKLSAVPS